MKYGISVLSTIIIFLCLSGFSSATIMHYSVSGEMAFCDTNWNNYYVAPIFGDMYIDDNPSVIYSDSSDYIHSIKFDIVSFAINAGEYGWGGIGYISEILSGYQLKTYLIGVGDWDRWEFGHEGTVHMSTQLPETIDLAWVGWGWYYGDEFFSRVHSLVATASSSPTSTPVPEPSTMLLLGAGLLGLMGFRKFKK